MHVNPENMPSVISINKTGGDEWNPSCLDGLVQGITRVEEVTEESFLKLGNKINALHANAKDISLHAGEALDVMHGEGGEATLQHLQLLVERCSLWLSATDNKSSEICALLKDVLAQINELELPVLGLRKVIKTLHSLRVSTRVEASKGYASGTEVLAKSLDDLGALVQAKVAEVADQLEGLIPVIHRSIEVEEGIRFGSIKRASTEIERARKLLSQFLETCLETGQWTDRLNKRSSGVASSFSEIVAALQFQDITRQRLEHVQKALESLSLHLATFSQRSDFSKDVQAKRLFRCICTLQHEQLEYAANEFVAAADNLSKNLQDMATNVLSMAMDTRELVRVSDDGSDNRYAVVLQALDLIAGHLETTGKAYNETATNLSVVTAGVEKVSELVDEIEFIGEEIQLLAINAAVSAAHARHMGAGLDIIAQNIQDVAEEACQHALALATQCKNVTGHSNRLQDVEEEDISGAGDVNPLVKEAKEHMQKLDTSHMQLVALAGKIDAGASDLSREVSTIVVGLHIGEVFRQRLAPVQQRFWALGQGGGEVLTKAENSSLDDLFKDLELCYTMASERKVHQGFIGGQELVADDANDPEDKWATGRQHDLGDNVDLF